MSLVELKLNEFVDVLSSDAPAPGGGSASALAGALGAALTCMVASLTAGKEKYKEHEALNQEILAKANELKKALLENIDRDTEAFNGVSGVFKMPKETAEEKETRKQAMQAALKNATKVPYDIMALAFSALILTEKAVGRSNTNAASDLGVAALALNTCVRGAWLNMLINLSSIKEQDFIDEYRKKGEEILDKALPLSEKIYNETMAQCQ